MSDNEDSPYVSLRNTISGIAQEYTAEQAQQWLNHPIFGAHLEIVRTNKPEVLSEPHDKAADGTKIPVEENAKAPSNAKDATK